MATVENRPVKQKPRVRVWRGYEECYQCFETVGLAQDEGYPNSPGNPRGLTSFKNCEGPPARQEYPENGQYGRVVKKLKTHYQSLLERNLWNCLSEVREYVRGDGSQLSMGCLQQV